MWPDGICRVTDTRYTKTIQYQDINYQLSQNEDKTAIFEAWCDFLKHLGFSFSVVVMGGVKRVAGNLCTEHFYSALRGRV